MQQLKPDTGSENPGKPGLDAPTRPLGGGGDAKADAARHRLRHPDRAEDEAGPEGHAAHRGAAVGAESLGGGGGIGALPRYEPVNAHREMSEGSDPLYRIRIYPNRQQRTVALGIPTR